MATALTQAWQTVATGSSSFTYGGNTYYITVYLQAYYEPYSATQAKIHLRELLSTSNSAGWSGTNKHYRVRFYPYENPPEDSGYNQDSTQWYAPGSSYYLPDSSGTVTHIINYGASIDIVAYYLVDVAPSSEVDIGAQVYAPSPAVAPATPTISSSALTSNSVAITYGTTSFGNPSTGTVTLYGGTTANPTTVLDTYNATGDHTFTHTNLLPSTTYYYRAKANNGQLDSSYSTEITITTDNVFRLYGSVNDEAKRIKKLYGSVNGETKEIKKLYGSVGGVTKRIY
ncbi:hypothetical protein IKF88_00630 [Candidatus Saccharibacteria bacterium]|nr:hypothetical protein [Candidatus Saccharibacteria bacterium]